MFGALKIPMKSERSTNDVKRMNRPKNAWVELSGREGGGAGGGDRGQGTGDRGQGTEPERTASPRPLRPVVR